MKCPICGEILQKYGEVDPDTGTSIVLGANCSKCGIGDSDIKLWQELIRTRKELEQSETCCTEWEKQALDYKAENIALSGDLERTRKALDVAVDALKKYTDASGNWWYGYEFQGHYEDYAGEYADKALEQITALEQKD